MYILKSAVLKPTFYNYITYYFVKFYLYSIISENFKMRFEKTKKKETSNLSIKI